MASVTLGSTVLDGVDHSGSRWVVERIDGWWGTSGSTLEMVQRPRGHGAWAGDAFLPPRHVAIEGSILGVDRRAALEALDSLAAAASLQDVVLSVDDETGVRWSRVRREDRILTEWLNSRHVRWSLQLAAPDPRRFGAPLSESTSLPSTTGGLTVPFAVPFTIDATTVTGQVSLWNEGNIAGPVRLRIDGPVTGPVVTHVNSGRSLVFSSSIVLGPGEWIDVDMERREVLANGQASRNGWVTSRGWSSFEPGANTWSFSAAVYHPDSSLTVEATPAWQ